MTDSGGNKIQPFIKDGTTYLPLRAFSEALGLNVNWDSEKNTVSVTGFAPYYRSELVDYDIIPISMSMQAGFNELQQYSSGKTIHSGEGYIDPFGVGTYTAGIGYAEASKFPLDQYFSKWWMENF
ncbi:MAG: copper amine oxidase N-terminal domain-containing protein, partial [Clostridiales bacterium]|nr:copper amine oxidase N-terminal domain-containing protein [Clostridiales bacterium]